MISRFERLDEKNTIADKMFCLKASEGQKVALSKIKIQGFYSNFRATLHFDILKKINIY